MSQEPHRSESSEGPGHSSHSKAQLTFFLIFIFFLTVLDLHCCKQTFSSFSERGLSSSCSAQASQCSDFLVGEHKLQLTRAPVVVARRVQSVGSLVVAHQLSCPKACGIFPDQGWNPCLLHGHADSLPLSHQVSPRTILITKSYPKGPSR